MNGSAGITSSFSVNSFNSAGHTFSDHFWSKDKKGLEIILDQMAKSNRTCETLSKIFEKRAQIEEEYGEKLLKLSQITLSNDDTSTFSDAFCAVPGAARATAEAHMKLAQDIKEILECPLADFVEKQKREREAAVEIINYDYQSRLLHLENVDRVRRAYVFEYDKLLKSRRSGATKDGIMQSSQNFDVADQEYKHAVEMCSANSEDWISNWKSACNTFQTLESGYMIHLLRALSTYSKLSSDVYLSDDQSYERICTGLENVDIRKELDTFIINHGTGEKPPGVPKYNKLEPPLTPEESALSERSTREVNIPVVDEELRSVNDQLKKLPTRLGVQSIKLDTDQHSTTGESLTKSQPEANKNHASEPQTKPVLALDPIPTHSLVDSQTSTPVSAKVASSSTVPTPHDKALPAVPQPEERPNRYLLEANQQPGDHDPVLRKLVDKTSVEQPDMPDDQLPLSERRFMSNTIASSSPNGGPRRHTAGPADFTKDIRAATYRKPPLISTARPPTWYNETIDPSTPFRFTAEPEPTSTKSSPAEWKKFHKFFPISFRKRKANKKTIETQSSFPGDSDRRHHSSIGLQKHEHRSMTLQPNNTMSNFQIPMSRHLSDGTPVLEYAHAAWDYNAKIETEMSFSKDDILAIISKNSDGWWLAEVVSGHFCPRGLVPSNFMRPL